MFRMYQGDQKVNTMVWNCKFWHQPFSREGRQLHVAFLKTGLLNYSVTVANRLLQLYTRCGFLRDASHLFDEMSNTNPFSWNTLIQAHLNSVHTQSALHLFLFNAMPCHTRPTSHGTWSFPHSPSPDTSN